jgi:hypothetical protein
MTETKKQEMRERFEKTFCIENEILTSKGLVTETKIMEYVPSEEIISFIDQENIRYAKEAVAEREAEVMEMISQLTERKRSVMPNGKFPIVIFGETVSDDTMWGLYQMGIEDVYRIIKRTQNPHSTGIVENDL